MEKSDYSQKMQVCMQIGKNGVTPPVITEISKQLEKKKVIKIKFLSNFSDIGILDEIIDLITKETGSEVVQRIGRVAVLKKG